MNTKQELRPRDMTRFVVIKGVTASGQVFRPSDWAQRLALAATAGTCPEGRPLCFRPEVRITTVDGVPAIMIDKSLERLDPVMFAYLLSFARQYDLQCAM